ncbi:30S ribosomal protein S20 [bacterium]|nr:30S ribosomal protein S20 [bacterium]
MAKPIGALNKRARQAHKRREGNKKLKSAFRSAVRKALEAVESRDESAEQAVRHACRIAAKTASKGVIHKNKAGRTASRLMKRLQGIAPKPPTETSTEA